MPAIANGEGGSSVRAKLNELLLAREGAAAAALRQVGTRCRLPNFALDSANRQCRQRTSHRMRASGVTGIRVGWANWYVAGSWGGATGAEVVGGGVATITATIEYPIGTYTRLQFSGSNSGTIASGATLISDELAISIPQGATFHVRSYITVGTGGLILACGFVSGNYIVGPELGEYGDVGASGLTDNTAGGAYAVSAGYAWGPCAILASQAKPCRSFALIGDSRASGLGDDSSDGGDVGNLERPLGDRYAYLNLSTPGDRLSWFISSSTRRRALAAYCTDVIVQMGANDLINSRTVAQVKADRQTIAGYFNGTHRRYVATMEPMTDSSDGWTTTANQTAQVTNASRIEVNEWSRGVPSGYEGCLELADISESKRNSGLWLPGYTSDGLHSNQRGGQQVRSAGVVQAAVAL